jgi:hypothetical protein
MGEAVWHTNRAIEDLAGEEKTDCPLSLLRTMQGMLYYAEEMFMETHIRTENVQ